MYSEDIFRSSSYVCSDKFTNVVSTQVINWLLLQTQLYEKKIILIISQLNTWGSIYSITYWYFNYIKWCLAILAVLPNKLFPNPVRPIMYDR